MRTERINIVLSSVNLLLPAGMNYVGVSPAVL